MTVTYSSIIFIANLYVGYAYIAVLGMNKKIDLI